ncbi:hypothetical protein HHK36_025307 [Tetracentron sinense]|uniref:Probable magnesium transporter n=1 Tax=Tetracentron sinense TaxID=13715 RepID=A0A834YKN1_TETSI|nr:hypothetical protein HHK36_025307 [Tetracentron sinense]
MGEWVIGAFINLLGSIAINFGTNLLKLGHNQRERLSMLDSDGTNGKLVLKPIIYFQTWRVGILFFALGNCLNFISFGYAAQSLLAALGSIQFVSNIAFAYFVLNKMVTVKYGIDRHSFYCSWKHLSCCLWQPPVTCLHNRGAGREVQQHYIFALLPDFGFGCCRASLHLQVRVTCIYTLAGGISCACVTLGELIDLHMARLNEGLSLFDAILIVPMFQIAWTFFSICTGFVYFQEYQVFDTLRTTMFILGMASVFIGITLLAPDESKGGEARDSSSLVSSTPPSIMTDMNRPVILPSEETEIKEVRSFGQAILVKATSIILKAKTACTLSLGLGDSISASSVLVMPMVSSRMTGFRGNGFDRAKLFSFKSTGWSKISLDEDDAADMMETSSMLSQSHG